MAMLALLAIPALVLYLARCFRVYLRNSEQYSRIPAVGSDNLLYSFWTAVRCIYESPVVFEEGYRRYKGRVFRVPQLTGWLVLPIKHILRTSRPHIHWDPLSARAHIMWGSYVTPSIRILQPSCLLWSTR